MDEKVGPENWRRQIDIFFLHAREVKSRDFGIGAWREWNIDPDTGEFESDVVTYAALEYTDNDVSIISRPNLEVSTTSLAYLGRPWILVLILTYIITLPFYFLRRPILRALHRKR